MSLIKRMMPRWIVRGECSVADGEWAMLMVRVAVWKVVKVMVTRWGKLDFISMGDSEGHTDGEEIAKEDEDGEMIVSNADMVW